MHRDTIACAQWRFSWGGRAPPSAGADGTTWLDSSRRSLAPHVHGVYRNYIDPTLADWAHAYDAVNLARRMRVKRHVDPDDFFHFAQSTPTSHA